MRNTVRWAVVFLAGWLALTIVGYEIASAGLPERSPAPAPAALPSRVDAPWLWTPTLAQAPIGAVPIVAGGVATVAGDVLTDSESVVVFADAAGRQRVLDVASIGSAIPGEGLLLAPDGAEVVYPVLQGIGLVVQNLSNGTARTLPTGNLVTSPLAWSPDQRMVVAVQYRAEGGGAVGYVDLTDGHFTPLLDTGPTQDYDISGAPVPGFSAAYSRSGAVAIQVQEQLCVFDGTQRQGCFQLGGGQRLAGKGAWTPDGHALAVLADRGRESVITLVSAATGAPVANTPRFTVTDVTTVRLLGWWPDGRAVVVAYRPEPGAPPTFDTGVGHGGPTDFDVVRRISVLALRPEGGIQEVITVPDALLSVDVADSAMASGLLRPFPAARAWPARPGMVAALTALTSGPVLFVLLVVVLVLSARRRPGPGRARPPRTRRR